MAVGDKVFVSSPPSQITHVVDNITRSENEFIVCQSCNL